MYRTGARASVRARASILHDVNRQHSSYRSVNIITPFSHKRKPIPRFLQMHRREVFDTREGKVGFGVDLEEVFGDAYCWDIYMEEIGT